MGTKFVFLLVLVNILEFSYTDNSDYWKTEKLFANNLEEYISNLKKDVQGLREHISQVKEVHAMASSNRKEYLTNPLGAYLLVKRLSTVWPFLSNTIKTNAHGKRYSQIFETLRINITYPEESDLANIVQDFIRHDYNLHLTDSSGNALLQLSSSTKYLNWDEYFIVGMKILGLSNSHQTKKWFSTAIDYFDGQGSHYQNLKILEYISEWAVKVSDVDLAIKTSSKILKIDQNHKIANLIKTLLENGNPEDLHIIEPLYKGDYKMSVEYKNYEKLCNNDIRRRPFFERHLKCKFDFAMWVIYPVKIEEVNADPRIILYHDVVHESEFESINLNINVQRSNVFEGGRDGSEKSSYRTSNEFRITRDEGHYFWDRISERITQITNLRLDYEGGTTVINYEPGNQYAPHWDFYRSHEIQSYCDYTGNRIATVLTYLSDVDEGGSTVFPFLGINVTPTKGSMLVWNNLHSTGHRDWRTKHAGCPVKAGSKWISTIWVHERLQTFTRPCGTDKYEWLKSQSYVNFFENFINKI